MGMRSMRFSNYTSFRFKYLPILVEIESGICYIWIIIIKYVVAISFPNNLFFARLFDQINNADRSVQCKFFTKMFFKCYLRFSLICNVIVWDYCILLRWSSLIHIKKYLFTYTLINPWWRFIFIPRLRPIHWHTSSYLYKRYLMIMIPN